MWPLYLPTHTLRSSSELPIISEPVTLSLSTFASLAHPVNFLQSPFLLYQKGRTGLFLLHAPTLFCKWSNRSINHIVCPFIHTFMHCYHMQSTLVSFGDLKVISFKLLLPTLQEYLVKNTVFFSCHLFTCLIGHLFEPDSIPDSQ